MGVVGRVNYPVSGVDWHNSLIRVAGSFPNGKVVLN